MIDEHRHVGLLVDVDVELHVEEDVVFCIAVIAIAIELTVGEPDRIAPVVDAPRGLPLVTAKPIGADVCACARV